MAVAKRNCRVCSKPVLDRMICQRGRGCRRDTNSLNPILNVSLAPTFPNPVTAFSASIPVTKQMVNPNLVTKKLVNHVAFVIDESGSMGHLKNDVVSYYNEQIGTLKQKSYDSKQATYVSLYTLGRGGVRCIQKEVYIEQAKFLTNYDYNPNGGTPLLDGMGQAITDLKALILSTETDNSFLVITITDGEENESHNWREANGGYGKPSLADEIKAMNGTDRWTFAFAGPQGSKGYLTRFGVLLGNCTEWEQTRRGVQQFAAQTVNSIGSYYDGRTMGQTMSKSFFSPNVSNVNNDTLKGLTNYNNKFRRCAITQDQPITDFVRGLGETFQVGKAFYELTKSEDIQDHKQLAICSKTTGQIFGGREAKDLLQLPKGGTIKVKPGNHGDYKIFVQSTSMNRKLKAGTELLWRL